MDDLTKEVESKDSVATVSKIVNDKYATAESLADHALSEINHLKVDLIDTKKKNDIRFDGIYKRFSYENEKLNEKIDGTIKKLKFELALVLTVLFVAVVLLIADYL